MVFPMKHKNIAIITDIAGHTLTREDKKVIAHPLVQGIILFTHNFVCSAQLIKLIDSIRNIKPQIIICVDHEGGRVQRFRSDGFTPLPAMQTLGNLFALQPQTALDLTYKTGWLLATELTDHGIDFSFTPVLDLDMGLNQVIGERSFGADAHSVYVLAEALIQGIGSTGMKVVAKHFPGHGHVKEDSHQTLPIDQRSLAAIESQDLLPFRYLIQKRLVDAVMPAHVLYPVLDSVPAGFSQFWLKDLLRKRLGFSGLIMSDDLSMLAVQAVGSLTNAAKLAIDAGVNALLVCQNQANTLNLLAYLDAAQVQPEDIRAMARRSEVTGSQVFSKDEVKSCLRSLFN